MAGVRGFLAALAMLLAVWPAAADPGRAEGGRNRDAARLYFLANEGFAVEVAGQVVLIDALQTVGDSAHGELPEATYARMLAARPPFASVALILVSHPHRDHHVPSTAASFLRRHPETRMAATPEVLKSLEGEQELPAIRSRLVEVHPEGENASFAAPGIRVDFFEFPHLAAEFYPVTVVGHLVQMGGKKILHVGDAELSGDRLGRLGLASRGIDVAILPYWVFTREGARTLIAKQIAPKKVVVMRLPLGGVAEARRKVRSIVPDAIFLTRAMESVPF